ncbi:myb/SANT-like DNA-binding domain-containing protein 1 [Uloborus diversus]|uniref:myb/SANT-like DNA-binding domain-containing protein 1 n=1 Tax=Uloborus diversus TaxID=327109 RepID=UPI0024092864|nr:myb/SANT-like DNA-binding domain-containing protein 1 [Uloborus diversus]
MASVESFSMEASKKNKNRSANWADEETKLLIQLWKENLNDLNKAKRNRIIYERMSNEMELFDIRRTADEIKTKIKNLIKLYRKEKMDHCRTGCCPSTWPYYAMINEALGSRPSCNFGQVKESTQRTVMENEVDLEEASTSINEGSIADTSVHEEQEAPQIMIDKEPVAESSFASMREAEKSRKKRKAKAHFIEELYEDYKQTKLNIQDTDNKILELLNTQNTYSQLQCDLLQKLIEKIE